MRTGWRGLHRHTLVRRTALFSLSIILSTVVGLFTIPVLVANLGAEQWGILAVLQSIAAFFSVVIAFGWGATGPSMIAATPRDERRQFFADSLTARGLLLVVGGPVSAVVSLLVTGQSPTVIALASVAYLLPGLSSAWFFIGTNQPGRLFLFDSLPPILGNIAGLIAVAFIPTLEAFLSFVALFSLTGVAVTAIITLASTPGHLERSGDVARIRAIYRIQLPGVTTTVTSSFYSSIPTVAVQVFAPQLLPVFALSDRLLKYAVLVLAPVLQSIQGWIPEDGPAAVVQRARQALWISVGVGVLGAAGLIVFSTPAAALLTHGEVILPLGMTVILGLAFLGEAVAQIAGLACLVALGASRSLAISSLVAALAGGVVIVLLTALVGAYGALAAICVTSLSLAVYRAKHVRAVAAKLEHEALF